MYLHISSVHIPSVVSNLILMKTFNNRTTKQKRCPAEGEGVSVVSLAAEGFVSNLRLVTLLIFHAFAKII